MGYALIHVKQKTKKGRMSGGPPAAGVTSIKLFIPSHSSPHYHLIFPSPKNQKLIKIQNKIQNQNKNKK